MKSNKYSDRMDVSTTISLYEYGLIRNPKTDRVIYCVNHSIEHTKENPPIIKTTFISSQDVLSALEDIPEGYFDFIGSTREKEISELDSSCLSYHIFSIEQYLGWFELY